MRRFLGLVAVLSLMGGCEARDPGPDAVRSADAEVSHDGEIAVAEEAGSILFLGTSLTAGYGLQDPDSAFPARIQMLIDSVGLDFTVVNAGVSGDTSAGGLARLGWLLNSPVQVLVLELGANDGLRGQDTGALRANLEEIIMRVREANPGAAVVLAGMEAPPNMGERYSSSFRQVFPDVAEAQNAVLIPFLLEGVAGEPHLNQADGIHPTEQGHELVAGHLWQTLEPVLQGIVEG